jgi:hypothetical protein
MTTISSMVKRKAVVYANSYSDTAWSERMGFAKTEREWAERAAQHLKAELKRADLTYEDLADKLKKHGFKETKASIASKLSRATMSAHFFLASLVAIGREQVTLGEI